MTLLNAGIDLISFSGILYSIYPPLFVALVVYSVGGTGVSLFLGRKLVGLNFTQEAQEANFRCACLTIESHLTSPNTDFPRHRSRACSLILRARLRE